MSLTNPKPKKLKDKIKCIWSDCNNWFRPKCQERQCYSCYTKYENDRDATGCKRGKTHTTRKGNRLDGA